MSPRSQEFMDEARDRLAVAREIVKSGHPGSVVNAAYYAMLNAARAALSERGEHSKTHTGTWTLFSATFVATGEFDQGLSALARRAKDAREKNQPALARALEATIHARPDADDLGDSLTTARSLAG